MPNENDPSSKRGGAFFAAFLSLAFLMGVLGSIFGFSLLGKNVLVQKLVTGQPTGTVIHQENVSLEENSTVIQAVKKVSPAVLSILTSRNVQDWLGNVIEQKGGGTGFIITSDGMILTNKHVANDLKTEYTVVTSDGKDYPAKILAQDPVLDLAIVKIEATGLPVVDLGSSDDLQIGQFVVAIGNALGEFQNSVTFGVVSAKDRQITAGGNGSSERLEGLIQTDAAINPGNSGGPMVNLKGQVVGINTAVSTDAQNIGFAIPINVAKTDIDSVKKTGKIVRPILGISYLPITKEVAKLQQLPVTHGALIVRSSQIVGNLAVVPGGPGDKAGLTEGDIITVLNTEEITETQSLSRLLQRYQVGDEITISYLRKGDKKDVKVKLDQAAK